MKKYKILICGENFTLDLGEGIKKYGFYANRFIEADNEENAKNLAVESIKQRKDIQTKLKNKTDAPPILNVEKIIELENFDEVDNLEQGFSWFVDENET